MFKWFNKFNYFNNIQKPALPSLSLPLPPGRIRETGSCFYVSCLCYIMFVLETIMPLVIRLAQK